HVTTRRTVWPANDDRLIVCFANVPATLVAAPAWLSTVLVVVPTTWTRKKSSVVALLRCAKYDWNVSVMVLPAGSAIAGDWIVVAPPSTSLTPALAPAAPAVTRS